MANRSDSWNSISTSGNVVKILWAHRAYSSDLEDPTSGFFECAVVILPDSCTFAAVRQLIYQQEIDVAKAVYGGCRRYRQFSDVKEGTYVSFTLESLEAETSHEFLSQLMKFNRSLQLGKFHFVSDALPLSQAQESIVSFNHIHDSFIILSPDTEMSIELPKSLSYQDEAPSEPALVRIPSLNVSVSPKEQYIELMPPPIDDLDIFGDEDKFIQVFERAIHNEDRTLRSNLMLEDGSKKICFTITEVLQVLQDRPPNGAVWADISGASPEDVKTFGNAFGVHPLTIEDCLPNCYTRQKLEPFRDYLFLVVESLHHYCHCPELMNSLRVLVFKNCVVSFHPLPLLGTSAARERLRKVFSSGYKKSVDVMDILHAILDSILDLDVPMVDSMVMESQNLEDLVFVLGSVERTDVLKRMSMARRKLSNFTQQLWPKRDILQSLVNAENIDFLTASHLAYFRDIYDHILVMLNKLQLSGDLLSTLESSYYAKISIEVSVTSNKMNQVMKQFNLVATIVLPLSFVTGLFGMNVKVPGQFGEDGFDTLNAFWIILGSMAFLTALMLYLFRLSNWL